ncbi:MAG: DUF5131 family protein [Verrucomicrobia bacterium]|nr:DUF5131 family protein [Verrucomicrobiota bacterium]
MAKKTGIQWCHTTVNPVAGCDGCPLWASIPQLKAHITNAVMKHAAHLDQKIVTVAVAQILDEHHGAKRIKQAVAAVKAALRTYVPDLSEKLVAEEEKAIRRQFRCYAGVLTNFYGGRNSGHPASFDVPQLFPGRMREAARYGLPTAAEIADKQPWMQGLRRLLFVSDMGDALSNGIEFDYLKQEIVDVAESAEGSRHIWLWLTKRAPRMAEFSDWLTAKGFAWPKNLVPMASILNAGYAQQALALLRIPSVVRGLSVEPLDNRLQLPVELCGPENWIIVGGESGVGAIDHPFEINWARGLLEQCRANGARFFMKQLGAVVTNNGTAYPVVDEHGGNWKDWPEDLRIREFPDFFRHEGLTEGSLAATAVCSLAAEDIQFRDEREQIVGDGVKASITAAKAIYEIHAYRAGILWSRDYRSFEAYCRAKWEYGKAHAYRLKDCGEFVVELEKQSPIGDLPKNEAQVRPLLALPMSDRVTCWKEITAANADGGITGKLVAQRTRAYAEAHEIEIPVKSKAPRSGRVHAVAALSQLRAAVAVLPQVDKIEALLMTVEELIGEKEPQIAA